MRDILFRGKRVDDGEWVEGDLVHRYDFSGNLEYEYENAHIKPIGKNEFEEYHACKYDSFWGFVQDEKKIRPTHWMPLPKLPTNE